MQTPTCPNYRERKGCERSELRFVDETPDSFLFTCACCHLFWAVSKPKTQSRAQWENRMRQVQAATEVERQAAARPKVFGQHYAGIRTVEA